MKLEAPKCSKAERGCVRELAQQTACAEERGMVAGSELKWKGLGKVGNEVEGPVDQSGKGRRGRS